MILNFYEKKIKLFFQKYLIFIILFFYVTITTISGLRGGIPVGVISITILYLAYRYNRSSYILMLYIFAYYYGFFKLMYSNDTYLFDMIFFLSNILVLYYLIKKQKILKHYFYMYLILIMSILFNIEEYNELYYQTFSLFNYFLVFGILLYLNKTVSIQVANIILFLSFFVILISILQMFGININLSLTYQVSNINILGMNFTRPSGVSGGIYKAGTKVLVALFLIYRYLPYSSYYNIFKKYKIIFFIFLFLTLFSSILSQRSIFLGLLIIIPMILIYKVSISNKIKTSFFVFTVISGLIVLPFTIYYLDASNALKFFMWVDVWNSFLDASIFNKIFGHGPFNVAYSLMGNNYGTLAEFYSIEGWDIGEIGTPKLPHNIFVQALYDHGLIYLLIYIYLIFKAVNIYFSNKNKYNNLLFYLIVILIINFALHNGIMNITLSLLYVYIKEKNANLSIQKV